MSRFARRAVRAARPTMAANLLLGLLATSNVGESTQEPGHPLTNLTDGNEATRWISQPSSPVHLTYDLGAAYTFNRVEIVFAADTIKNYTVSVSSDNSSWTAVAAGITNNTTTQTVTITSFTNTPLGRYLRVTGTDRWNTTWGNSVWEIRAYGVPVSSGGVISSFAAAAQSNTSMGLSWAYSGSTVTNFTLKRAGTTIATLPSGTTTYTDTGLTAGTSYSYTIVANLSAGGTSNTASASGTTTGGQSGTNILLNKPASSSVGDSTSEPGNPPANVTDNSLSTRWISLPSSPADLTIDMQGVFTVDQLEITFAADTIKNYTLSYSGNGSSWTQFASGITNNTSSQLITHGGLSGVSGRYVRVTATDRWNTSYGNSVWEIKGYGTQTGTVPYGTISGFTATVLSDTSIKLDWSYSGSVPTNLTLKRGGTTIATLAAGTVTYTNTGLTAGTSYNYSLVANLSDGSTSNTATTGATTTGGTSGVWSSGASCVGVGWNLPATAPFATWRGTPLGIATTWPCTSEGQVALWGIAPGGEYDNWSADLDIAIGAIFTNEGESWGAAAGGAYDGRWSQSLTNMKNYWTNKSRGTCYIRFAHELNGNWYPWSVYPGDISSFITAWRRFYTLKQSIFPASKVVMNTNGNTVGQAYDWRTFWPGDSYVDVYSTDWYAGHYKQAVIDGQNYDGYGGPVGMIEHRQFAAAHGVPFAIPEWGVDHKYGTGDDPNYIQYMHDFFSANGGTGAGKVIYDIYFNLSQGYANDFQIFYEGTGDSPSNPNSAARYRQLF